MPRYQTRVPNTRVACQLGIRAASLDLSAFVKLAYALIGCAALVYLAIRISRGGSLAAAAEMASAGLVFAIGALVLVFGVLVVGSSLRFAGRGRQKL
jgi:hypothetical protein